MLATLIVNDISRALLLGRANGCAVGHARYRAGGKTRLMITGTGSAPGTDSSPFATAANFDSRAGRVWASRSRNADPRLAHFPKTDLRGAPHEPKMLTDDASDHVMCRSCESRLST
jgi:hypothetical protein